MFSGPTETEDYTMSNVEGSVPDKLYIRVMGLNIIFSPFVDINQGAVILDASDSQSGKGHVFRPN
jgi:hypothetical protein